MPINPVPPGELGLTVLLDQLWPGLYLATWHWRDEPAGHCVLADLEACARTQCAVADVAVAASCSTIAEADLVGQDTLSRYANATLAVAEVVPSGPSAEPQVWIGWRDNTVVVLPQRPTVSIRMWATAGYACVLGARPLTELADMIITAQPRESSSSQRWSWPA